MQTDLPLRTDCVHADSMFLLDSLSYLVAFWFSLVCQYYRFVGYMQRAAESRKKHHSIEKLFFYSSPSGFCSSCILQSVLGWDNLLFNEVTLCKRIKTIKQVNFKFLKKWIMVFWSTRFFFWPVFLLHICVNFCILIGHI